MKDKSIILYGSSKRHMGCQEIQLHIKLKGETITVPYYIRQQQVNTDDDRAIEIARPYKSERLLNTLPLQEVVELP